MLGHRRVRQPEEKWIDKLAPKVAEIREALKCVSPKEIAWRSRATLQGDQLYLKMLFQPYEVDTNTYVVSKAAHDENITEVRAARERLNATCNACHATFRLTPVN